MNDSLGDRMKRYENSFRYYLPIRMPLIIRIDGKAFHTLTRHCEKPFDKNFMYAIQKTMCELAKKIEGCKFSYCQSDEISLLLTDYDQLNTESWFGKNLQKIVSVSASIATAEFNSIFLYGEQKATFDSRTFILPKEEVCNYFIWRQQDATRNAIQMLGQSHFSHKQLHGLSCNDIQEKLFTEKNINFNDLDIDKKRGSCAYKKEQPFGWTFNAIPPIFTEDREFIEKYL